MVVNVNCIYNDKGAWCLNPNVKRSLLGVGARICTEYGKISCRECPHAECNKRPVINKKEKD